MALISQEWTGGAGLIYYGETLLFVDTWSAEIVSDSIDITNISIYTGSLPLPLPVDDQGLEGNPAEPFPKNLPDTKKPYVLKATNNLIRKQTQYGAGRLMIDGGLRVANLQMSGLCASYDEVLEQLPIPRINNYVYVQLTNSIDGAVTLFNFPIVLIQNVTFSYDVKNYQRWTLNGVTSGEFDVFPGILPN